MFSLIELEALGSDEYVQHVGKHQQGNNKQEYKHGLVGQMCSNHSMVL